MDRLLRMHYDTIRAVCHRIVIDRGAADDATQQALISIVRALPRFDGKARFSTWAFRIATNAAIDEVRRTKRRAVPVDDEFLSLATPATPDATGYVDAEIDFRAALQQVAPEYREVLALRHVAGLEYGEISEALGIPVGTVRSRLARGRAQLVEAHGNTGPSTDRQTTVTDPEAGTP